MQYNEHYIALLKEEKLINLASIHNAEGYIAIRGAERGAGRLEGALDSVKSDFTKLDNALLRCLS